MANGWGDDNSDSSPDDGERQCQTIEAETSSESSSDEETSQVEPPLARDDNRDHPLDDDDLAAWIRGSTSLTHTWKSDLFRLVILEWARRRRHSDPPSGAPPGEETATLTLALTGEATVVRTDTPLHEIARGRTELYYEAQDVDEILSLFPDGLLRRDGAGETPLHAALSCRNYCFAALLLEWLRPRPRMGEEVASIQNDYGCSPLHHAVRYGAPPKVLRRVASLCPGAALMRNRLGFTPLHEAAREGSPRAAKEVLKRLTNAQRREVICAKSEPHGETALHWTQSPSVFLELLSMCPEAAIVRNHDGCTPFHRQARWFIGKKVTFALQRASPEAASAKRPADGRTPLHTMCDANVICLLRGQEEKTLRAFRDVSPEVGLIRDDAGDTALHIAISGTHSLVLAELAKAYIDIWPSAASISNKKGDTPLHIACAHLGLPTLDVVESLLRAHPESMRKPNKSGATPLHILFSLQTVDSLRYFNLQSLTTGVLEKMLAAAAFCADRENGRLVSGVSAEIGLIQDMSANTPLHFAASDYREFITSPSIGAYVEAWPRAASLANTDGNTPLHVACACAARSRPDLIALLLCAHPDAAHRVNRLGQTPLHVLCSVRSMRKRRTVPLPTTVSLLLEALPKAVKLPDAEGNTPLHCAFLTKADNATKARLLGVCGKALGAKNDDLRTALHCACMTRANSKILSSLLDAYPQAAEMADRFGNTPLHYAFVHKCSASAKRLLAKAAAGALRTPNANMQRPLHLACKYRNSTEVLSFILGLAPDFAIAADKEGNTPVHLAFLHHLPLDTKRTLLEAGSGAVRMTNSQGEAPLSMSRTVDELFHLIRALPHLVRLY